MLTPLNQTHRTAVPHVSTSRGGWGVRRLNSQISSPFVRDTQECLPFRFSFCQGLKGSDTSDPAAATVLRNPKHNGKAHVQIQIEGANLFRVSSLNRLRGAVICFPLRPCRKKRNRMIHWLRDLLKIRSRKETFLMLLSKMDGWCVCVCERETSRRKRRER